MECIKIKELLSEYIDGVLDDRTRPLVEEHLKTCKACSEELASLKACIHEVSSLKGVEAPEDFLEKVHERLERRFEFKKIIRKLFIPLQIKVPLEVAAVVATVLLVIYITNTIQPTRDMGLRPLADEKVLFGKELVEEHRKLGLERKVSEPPAVSKAVPKPEAIPSKVDLARVSKKIVPKGVVTKQEVAVPEGLKEPIPGEEEKIIELALLIKAEEIDLDKTVRETELGEKTEEMKSGVSIDAERVAKEGSADKAYDKDIIEYKARAKAKKELQPFPETGAYEVSIQKDTKALASPYLEEALSKVKNLIELVEGEVLSVDYIEETNLPHTINAEIPTVNYNTFLEKIGQFGDLQKPIPLKAIEGKDSIPLKIKLIPPK